MSAATVWGRIASAGGLTRVHLTLTVVRLTLTIIQESQILVGGRLVSARYLPLGALLAHRLLKVLHSLNLVEVAVLGQKHLLLDLLDTHFEINEDINQL